MILLGHISSLSSLSFRSDRSSCQRLAERGRGKRGKKWYQMPHSVLTVELHNVKLVDVTSTGEIKTRISWRRNLRLQCQIIKCHARGRSFKKRGYHPAVLLSCRQREAPLLPSCSFRWGSPRLRHSTYKVGCYTLRRGHTRTRINYRLVIFIRVGTVVRQRMRHTFVYRDALEITSSPVVSLRRFGSLSACVDVLLLRRLVGNPSSMSSSTRSYRRADRTEEEDDADDDVGDAEDNIIA